MLLAIVLGLLLAIVVGEVATRLVLRAQGQPHDADRTRLELEKALEEARAAMPSFRGALPQFGAAAPGDRRILHPFSGWDTDGTRERTAAELARARQGLDARADAAPEELRVLVLGGSVARLFEPVGVPRLFEALKADPRLANRTPVLWGHACNAYKQPQQLMALAWLFSIGIVPDVVIEIDGHNEVTIGLENASRGTFPAYPSIVHWGALAVGGALDREAMQTAGHTIDLQDRIAARTQTLLEWHVEHSALASALGQRSVRALQRQRGELQNRFYALLKDSSTSAQIKGPPFPEDPAELLRTCVEVWGRSSRSMRALCQSRGVTYLHVLQPTLFDPAGRPPTEAERAAGTALDSWMRGVREGYPLLREAGRALAAEGENFCDATDVFVGLEGDIYYDVCHFNDRGNTVFADRIAQALLRALPAR